MKVVCINNDYLTQLKTNEVNENKPRLELGKEYEVLNIIKDSEGNPHYDVGILSSLSYIRSVETGEELPDGDKIHWCHPSRFTQI